MSTHGFSDEEWVLRVRLVAELNSGAKTLLQIQQELRDYRDPESAALRRYREREELVQTLLRECETPRGGIGFFAAAHAVRVFGRVEP